jgi:aspartate/methionine/tyrosine aminotransferase
MVICAPHIAQLAALHGIRHSEVELAQKIDLFEKLTEQLRESTRDLKAFRLRSAGAFFAYLEHPFEKMNSTQAALELFRQTGILSLPGSVFGSSQEKYLRLAYGNLTSDQLECAMQALKKLDNTFSQ